MERPSPLQNRVLATGAIVANPARGHFMGNRGILHDETQRLGRARWKHKAWVTCRLAWKDWHREVMQPGNYTELFFHDEAVALAAGHRPCALCRRANFNAYSAAAGPFDSALSMDAQLHNDRAIPRRFEQRRTMRRSGTLPNGAIVLLNEPHLLWDDAAFPIAAYGYRAPITRPRGNLLCLTPETSLRAMQAGYVPQIIGGPWA